MGGGGFWRVLGGLLKVFKCSFGGCLGGFLLDFRRTFYVDVFLVYVFKLFSSITYSKNILSEAPPEPLEIANEPDSRGCLGACCGWCLRVLRRYLSFV